MSEKKAAMRNDAGKVELDYLDTFPVALDGVARNCMYGASKYALWNFLDGAKSSRESYNASRRHQLKWFNGEDWVPDAAAAGFAVHHIDAAIWNLLRLRQELHDFPDRDDRPCKRGTKRTVAAQSTTVGSSPSGHPTPSLVPSASSYPSKVSGREKASSGKGSRRAVAASSSRRRSYKKRVAQKHV